MIRKSDFKKVMSQYATGVTIVTTFCDGKNYGFTVNSFTSVSIDPPLVLFCVKKESETCAALLKSRCFAINILSSDQEDLSNLFSNPSIKPVDRFVDLDIKAANSGCPLLPDTLGWIDCSIWKEVEAGDHFIFIGQVNHLNAESVGKGPLLYFRGRYEKF